MVDLTLFNGKIRTQDSQKPFAEAIAVKDGVFAGVGKTDDIKGMRSRGTKEIDLKGQLVLPGFTDSHFHFYDWSLGRKWIDFSCASSLRELLRELNDAIKNRCIPDLYEGWVLGQNWNESDWPEERTPTKEDLDGISNTRPILLWRSDLHLAVANSKALEIAGINEDTKAPEHGALGRDDRGLLNGILQDHAIDLVKEKIPKPGDKEVAKAMYEGISLLHSMGMTGLHDLRLMDGSEGAPCFRALQILDKERALDLRVWMCISANVLEEAKRIGLRTGMGSDYLRIGHVKIFADGSVGAATAWVNEPYLDGGTGFALEDIEEISHWVRKAESSGLSVAVHAIGDRANHEVIKMFSRLKQEGYISQGNLNAPHRIEHLQVLKSRDIALLGGLGVMGSVQPLQAMDDIYLSERRLGARGALAFRFRDLLDNGIDLAFGSDCPVADPNPFLGIHAAVTRQRVDGRPPSGWFPEQRITVEEAVQAYTVGAARITGRSDLLGSISLGKLADFIVLDRDIFTIPPELIPQVRVTITCIGGKIVYES